MASRNPIIERALSKGFKSGGTIGDIGGGTGVSVRASGGGRGGGSSPSRSTPTTTSKKQEKKKEVQVKDIQRDIARKKVGPVTRREVNPITGEVTYYGFKGKYTFPSTTQVKFTGADKPGGLPSAETLIYVRQPDGRIVAMTQSQLEQTQGQEFVSRLKETGSRLDYEIEETDGQVLISRRQRLQEAAERQRERIREGKERPAERAARLAIVAGGRGDTEFGQLAERRRGELLGQSGAEAGMAQFPQQFVAQEEGVGVLGVQVMGEINYRGVNNALEQNLMTDIIDTAKAKVRQDESHTGFFSTLTRSGMKMSEPFQEDILNATYKTGDVAITAIKAVDKGIKAVGGLIPKQVEDYLFQAQKDYMSTPSFQERLVKFGAGMTGKTPTYEFIPKPFKQSGSQVLGSAGGYVEGLRTETTKTALTTGAFFLLPGALKVTGKAVKSTKIGANIWEVVSPSVTGLIMGNYAKSIEKRVKEAENKPRELGKIASTEITPFLLGGYAGTRFFAAMESYYRTKNLQFISVERMVRKEVILGEQNFPTAPQAAEIQYKIFVGQRKFKLPDERMLKDYKAMYHAAADSFSAEAVLGAGSSYIPGFYGATELSTYFLKIRGEGYSYFTPDILDVFSTPTGVRQQVLGFKTIPRSFRGKMDVPQLKEILPEFDFRVSYLKESEYILTKAEKGIAYIPGKKTEIEAILKPGTESVLAQLKYFTRIPSVKQAQKYEFIEIKGFQRAIKRVKKFNLLRPSTYLDKVMGRKAGTIKSVGIKKGQRVPIEQRGLKEITTANKNVVKEVNKQTNRVSNEYLYGKRRVPSSYVSYSRGTRSYSRTSRQQSSSLKRYSSQVNSYLSRAYSDVSSLTSTKSSRVTSKSSSMSSVSSYVSSFMSSYTSSLSRVTSGSSGRSSLISVPPTRPPRTPPLLPKQVIKTTTKPKKIKYKGLLSKYAPSLYAIEFNIKVPKVPKLKELTGLEVRPLRA